MDAEDFRQVRDAVRQLVRQVVVPLEDRVPDELRARAAETGLFGCPFPRGVRGPGPHHGRASIGPSSAKPFCTERVGRAVDRAVQVHGGPGDLRTTPVERFRHDARLYRLHARTSEVQRVIVGGGLVRDAGMPRG